MTLTLQEMSWSRRKEQKKKNNTPEPRRDWDYASRLKHSKPVGKRVGSYKCEGTFCWINTLVGGISSLRPAEAWRVLFTVWKWTTGNLWKTRQRRLVVFSAFLCIVCWGRALYQTLYVSLLWKAVWSTCVMASDKVHTRRAGRKGTSDAGGFFHQVCSAGIYQHREW